ncbi:isopentenyl-diphosphate delta-isomerase [Pyronema omphalodes]|nr:isopentenyl-diphosphate delta-isomerase [Pyronema omphalodes]
MTLTTSNTAEMAHPKITAENIYQLFPEIEQQRNTSAAAVGTELQGYDATQVSLMDEVCIVLDDDDKPIAGASKKICHLMTNIERGLLHRAFSVFLFDSQKRLLLQQRADEKITFAGMWTNTCCSHPLDIPTETGVTLEEGIAGVKNAAQRKLEQELGIPANQVPPEIFKFLTRIHYKAPSNGPWGEHEIDYILFAQATVDLAVNPNEAKDVRYVTPEELKAMFQDPELTFTPWFKLICETMLFEWWENFENLDKYLGEKQIRRM